jgi:hypothetical protein
MNNHRRRKFWERNSRLHLLIPVLLALLPVFGLMCQGQETRTEEIEEQREKKAAQAKPDEPSKVEKSLTYVEDGDLLERLTAGYHGWNLRLGGLVQGSGFALGPEYRLHSDFLGDTNFLAGAQVSTKLYQK